MVGLVIDGPSVRDNAQGHGAGHGLDANPGTIDKACSIAEMDAVIASVHEGVFEDPLWTGFLTKLRRMTGSDYASMSFRRADAKYNDSTVIRSGSLVSNESTDRQASEILLRLRLPYDSLEINRPYSLQEIADQRDPNNREYLGYLKARGFADTCVMRVAEPGGGNAWLTIGCSTGRYSAWIKAFLRRIAPHLGIAVHTLARFERERVRADIASEAVQKLNFGWVTFDVHLRVIEIAPALQTLFRKIPGLARCCPGQVFPFQRVGTTDLLALLAKSSAKTPFQPRAVHLVEEPWLDMLVVPIRYRAVSGGVTPVAVGYVHGIGAASADRCEQLMRLFGLARSEARLALVLSQGRSIAEAATELGFTIETARNYSKRVYAKTDTRGQADLVRIILASVIALS